MGFPVTAGKKVVLNGQDGQPLSTAGYVALSDNNGIAEPTDDGAGHIAIRANAPGQSATVNARRLADGSLGTPKAIDVLAPFDWQFGEIIA